jgi:hypothetical protein
VPSREGGWGLVIALSVAQLVSWGTVYYGFPLFVVPMEGELGWSRAALNGALSLGLLTAGLAAWGVGRLIDREGGRRVMSAGSLASALLLAAWSQVESPWVFYLIWMGLGAAMAATLYEPAFTVLTRSFPDSYPRRITVLTLLGGFASTVFVPLTQLFIEVLGWRHALLALALCQLLVCLPIHLLLLRDGGTGGPAGDGGGFRRAVRHPAFWALAVCFTAYYASFSAVTFHLVPLLVERGLSMGVVVAVVAIIGPSQVAGRLALLAIGPRLDAAALGRIVMPLLPASVLVLLVAGSFPALVGFAIAYGVANGVMTIVRGTAPAELLGREGYGAINGALSAPSNLAKALAPLAAALLWTALGYDAVLWTVIAGSALAALAFHLAVRLAGRPLPARRHMC